MQLRGPYAFGSQVGEPWRGPYTFGEPDNATPPTLNSGAPAGRVVSFTVTAGEPPFLLDYKDGSREGNSYRLFDHTFLSAGTFVVALTDAWGRGSTKSVTVA